MNSVIRNNVTENGKRGYFHSENHLPIIEIEESIIQPVRAVQILKDGGLIVTIEQANAILEFLYKLTDVALSQYFPK
jgi:hypothetical protein